MERREGGEKKRREEVLLPPLFSLEKIWSTTYLVSLSPSYMDGWMDG